VPIIVSDYEQTLKTFFILEASFQIMCDGLKNIKHYSLLW